MIIRKHSTFFLYNWISFWFQSDLVYRKMESIISRSRSVFSLFFCAIQILFLHPPLCIWKEWMELSPAIKCSQINEEIRDSIRNKSFYTALFAKQFSFYEFCYTKMQNLLYTMVFVFIIIDIEMWYIFQERMGVSIYTISWK